MRTRPLLLLSASALLAGCTSSEVSQELLENPLYAEWYHQDIVDHIVSLELSQTDALKDADAKRSADETRQASIKAGDEAEAIQQSGLLGNFIEADEPVEGEVLLWNGALYTDPGFLTVPGTDLRVYLSTSMDPREQPFPSEEDIELGPLLTPYGAQTLSAPETLADIRTVVLWDAGLKRMHAFAQVRRTAAE